MSHYIYYGLLLETSEFLEYIREHLGEPSLKSLARFLLKESNRKLGEEEKQKLKDDPDRFFLRDLNLIENFEGLTIYPLKDCKYVLIGEEQQFNSRWQKPDYLYSVKDIFPLEWQKELKILLRKHGFPAKRCKFYLSLNPFDILLPVPESDSE